jgi:hypothetical protein
MEANELRAGNWVNHSGVWSHRDFNQSTDFQWDFSDWYALGECTMSLDDVNPIPLTEEWLLKFGFSDKEYKNGFIGIDFIGGNMIMDFALTKPLIKGEWQTCYVYELSDYRFVKVNYLHQLQNLFFALTNQELTIKEVTK